MPYPFPPDLSQLVHEHMASGKYSSEDELLRAALRALAEEDEDIAAVKEAIFQWWSGDEGVPLDEAFESVRSTHRRDSH
jgi:putative addiction module CopG family antidote